MQKATFTGNIINVKLATDRNGNIVEPQFLNVTVACEDSKKNSIRIKYTDNNGMLKSFQNGEDLTGLRVVVHGDIDLTGIRSHYTQDGVNKTLKYPEIGLKYHYTERVSSKKEEPAEVVQPELVSSKKEAPAEVVKPEPTAAK